MSVTPAKLRKLALALEGVAEVPHMDRAAFRTKRRIFATLAADAKTVNVKLSEEQQDVLVRAKGDAFSPVPGGWGRMGWTTVTLAAVDEAALRDALAWAHAAAAPKRTTRPKKKGRPA